MADMLGQLIMPRLEIAKYEANAEYRSFINTLIEQKMVVGFCIFGGTIESLPLILDALQALAKKKELPELLMSCDCEWGLPMRLHRGGTEFPHMMALEQMNDQLGIKRVAQAIGTEMASLGLHWNFAPVADINSNSKNPIINIRSFSGDAKKVAECAKNFYEGLESAGIISTAKHFPGHGDTQTDSHRDLPFIDKSAAEFDALELLPFKYLSQQGIPAIMTGHIAAPKLAESMGASHAEKNLPATISSYLTQKLLREHIGFEGLIITDSLEMYGLQKVMNDPAEIAIHAFIAGSDILLMPTDPVAAYNGLKSALEQQRISIQSVENSISRIDKLRQKYVNSKPARISVKWLDHQEIAHEAARNSIRSIGSIPKPFSPSSVLIISSSVEKEEGQRNEITLFFTSEFPELKLFFLSGNTVLEEIAAGKKPLVITVHRPRGVLTEDDGSRPIQTLVKQMIDIFSGRNIHPAGVLSIGDPYIADEFTATNPDFILKTYSDSHSSVVAALQLFKKYI